MANGYGSSSGSSGSSSSARLSGSARYSGSESYEDDNFVKIKDGVKAPEGFHYMPNGRLMNDADHIAVNGYSEKKITSVEIDYRDIDPSGGRKTITVIGSPGFIFSLEIYEGSRASYYNFKTKAWATSSYKLTNIQGANGAVSVGIDFPAQSTLKTFTINIYAETVENIKTTHNAFQEVKNEDGSLNLNASTGSDSGVITKTLYQDVVKHLYLSAISPSKTHSSTGTTNGAVSSNRMIIDQDATDPSIVEVGDLISCTGIAGTLGVLVTKINPDGDNIHEIEMSAADVVSDGVTVTFFPAFRGMIPNNISSTVGRADLEITSGSSGSFEFSVTLSALGGRGFYVNRLPVAEDLCFINPITFTEAATGEQFLPITGEDISADTYHRWPITNIANITNGMILDPSRTSTGVNTTTPALISDYSTTKTLQEIDESNRYYTDVNDYTEQDAYVQGVDGFGNVATAVDRNGRVTAKVGNLAFNVQQANALKDDEDVLIIAQGIKSVQEATGIGVSLSGVTITKTQVSTTTSAASSASTTIAATEVQDIVVGASVRAVGINSAVANPTVVSKAAVSGGANIVVSAAQTLEDGITLFFDGPSKELVIKGTINVSNMAIADTTLYFNVENFLSCR